jgi:hypothetical protein
MRTALIFFQLRFLLRALNVESAISREKIGLGNVLTTAYGGMILGFDFSTTNLPPVKIAVNPGLRLGVVNGPNADQLQEFTY